MDKKQGKIICFEGIDGSGKTTQVDLLSEYLKDKNIPYEVVNFPRYEDNLYGKLIKRYLEGEFGSIQDVNPYLVALAYAGDRALAKAQIEEWLGSGKLIIANRYASSSKAHLGANLPDDKREEFFKWLDKLEYTENGVPRENLTILLNVDPSIGQKNVEGKHHPDIHENDLNHLSKANKIYLELSKTENNWRIVNCMEDGKMKSVEKIHQEIIEIISANIPS